MSTTFGVRIKGKTIPVARRVGIGDGKVSVYFLCSVYEALIPGCTPVHAMDNGSQGINNVYDLRKLTENYKDETFRKTF